MDFILTTLLLGNPTVKPNPELNLNRPVNPQQICQDKSTGIPKEEYLSEFPSSEDIQNAKPSEKPQLQKIQRLKQQVSTIWDNCLSVPTIRV